MRLLNIESHSDLHHKKRDFGPVSSAAITRRPISCSGGRLLREESFVGKPWRCAEAATAGESSCLQISDGIDNRHDLDCTPWSQRKFSYWFPPPVSLAQLESNPSFFQRMHLVNQCNRFIPEGSDRGRRTVRATREFPISGSIAPGVTTAFS
jgi:hypothetical protein